MNRSHAQPLDWHEECYFNWKATLQKQQDEIIRLQKRFEDEKQRLDFYERQILTAKERGKTSFDRDRYLKPAKQE